MGFLRKLENNSKYNSIKLSNYIFLIFAVIHFGLVCFAQYNMGELNIFEFDKSQFNTFIVTKIITFYILIIFYQFILLVITGFRNNNNKIKELTKYFLIYFIPNLILLFMIFPGVHIGETMLINNSIIHYRFDKFFGYSINIFQLLSYNVYPSLFGISLCHIFIFSLILSYIIYTLKNELYNGKYVYIMYSIFFIPNIMILNSNPYKETYIFWILILIFTIILISYKTKRNITNNPIAIGLAVLFYIAISIRFECLVLLILLPAIIYFFKIFDKKRFLVFICTFLLLFFGFNYIEKQDKISFEAYKLHNLSFVYDKLINSKFKMVNKLTDEDKLVLKRVYPEFETKGVRSFINQSDVNNVKRVKSVLSKHIVLNIFNLYCHSIYVYQYYIPKQNDYLILTFFDGQFYTQEYEKKFKFINFDLRNKILSNTMITSKYSSAQLYLKTIGNPYFYYLTLFLILVIGIKYKRLFYIWFSSIFILIFSLLMILVPWYALLYVIPYYMCACWIFMIFVFDTVQYLKKQEK